MPKTWRQREARSRQKRAHAFRRQQGLGLTRYPGWKDPVRYAPHLLRLQILIRDDYKCRFCKTPLTLNSANIDHVMPWHLGGPTNAENMVAICRACNKKKGRSIAVATALSRARTQERIDGILNSGKLRGFFYVDGGQQSLRQAAYSATVPCEHRMSPHCSRRKCLIARGILPQ